MEFGIKNITLTMLLGVTALGSQAIALPAAVYGVMMYIPGVALLVCRPAGLRPATGGCRTGSRGEASP